jgi:hypothetical protein
MSTKLEVTFLIKAWDETIRDDFDNGKKLTRATVQKKFIGGIEGIGMLEYLMIYTDEATANFVGLERIVGNLGELSGSFVLQHVGSYSNGISQASLLIIPDSGTGELENIRGEGSFEFGHAQEYVFTLYYSLD